MPTTIRAAMATSPLSQKSQRASPVSFTFARVAFAIDPAELVHSKRASVSASTAISTAAPTAMTLTTSMPLTHCTVEVDRATVNVSSKTSATDQMRPPPSAPRARSQAMARRFRMLSKAASGPARRPSGDTYRIPGPHEASEVVALAHDVQVDVLAQVEAWVLVRASEAGDIEVEHDERRAAASHRLQQANPFRIRAGRDDGDGASWKPADAVPREGLGQRCAPVGLAHREVVEDEAVLAHRPMRLEHS